MINNRCLEAQGVSFDLGEEANLRSHKVIVSSEDRNGHWK